MALKLYNTLTRKKEIFKPLKAGKVGMYSCGPTVYWYQHIGNMRAYLFSDLLKRTLKFNGYEINHVINVTDVGHLTSDSDEGEDKIENAAKKEGKTAKEIAEFYFESFKEDLKKLNILYPKIWPKASEHIREQIELIKKLEENNFTYRTSDGIYFDSSKFKDYDKLARLNISGLDEGKRISKGEKRNKTDFALWKFSEKGKRRQQEWVSPWGMGFPGWHLECSAMSMKYLGETFDIHTGGEDHIPIHHTNEIAQSESATRKKFVNYWMHVSFLQFKGEKVSKSKGGLYRITELEDLGYDPLSFRYLILLTHYRKPLNFTLKNLDAAKNAYMRLRRKVVELKRKNENKNSGKDKTKVYNEMFLNAINDDLNFSKALQVIWDMIDDQDFNTDKKLRLLEKFDEVLGLNIKGAKKEKIEIPSEIQNMLEKREEARKNKDWKLSDLYRERIKREGYLVEDSSEGFSLKKINK